MESVVYHIGTRWEMATGSRVHLKPWRFSSGWVREGCVVHTYDSQLDMAIVDDVVHLAAELQIYLNAKAVEVALTPIETAPLPNLGQWLNSMPTLGTCGLDADRAPPELGTTAEQRADPWNLRSLICRPSGMVLLEIQDNTATTTTKPTCKPAVP